MEADAQLNRRHKTATKGLKAKKQKSNVKRHNPKAFTFSGGVVSSQRKQQRAFDLQTKRERVSLVPDKTSSVDSPPPFIVVIQGPRGVGKSTLLRSLVRHYLSRSQLKKLSGPVTIVTGRHRRITFIECENDVASMVDLAKIADLVLLLIDASYGYELESFEFINILQTHGFPRVIGVLNHLDKIKDGKALKKCKKAFKDRFWAELYDGAKLFYLTGLHYDQMYRKMEIGNLTRFLSVQKPPLLTFRSQRPYMLALRYDEEAVGNDISDDRDLNKVNLVVYGYVCGAALRSGQYIHIPGAGDFTVSVVEQQADPCPLPVLKEAAGDGGRVLRKAKDKKTKVYAPGCSIGFVDVTDDALYVRMPKFQAAFTKSEKEEAAGDDNVTEAITLVRELQGADNQLDNTVNAGEIQLFKLPRKQPVPAGQFAATAGEGDASKATMSDDEEASDSDEESDSAVDALSSHGKEDAGKQDRADTSTDAESEHDLDSERELKSRSDDGLEMPELDARQRPRLRSLRDLDSDFAMQRSLQDVIYSTDEFEGSSAAAFLWRRTQRRHTSLSAPIRNLFPDEEQPDALVPLPQGSKSQTQQEARYCHQPAGYPVTGEPIAHPAVELLGNSLPAQLCPGIPWEAPDGCYLPAEELFGMLGVDTTVKDAIDAFFSRQVKAALKAARFITGGWDGANPAETAATATDEEGMADDNRDRQQLERESGPSAAAKKNLNEARSIINAEREKFRKDLTAAATDLAEVRRVASEQMGTFDIGTFVRVVIPSVPRDWLTHVKEKYATVILGGILPGETAVGQMQARIKKHRWAPKVLKTNDPIFVSLGWRRYQTLPMYCMMDRNDARARMLKYTLEHMHCMVTFYGPVALPASGILCIRNMTDISLPHYRISASGLVLEASPDFRVVKKLKLVGEPRQIMKNTAFIGGMFNSSLEVAKCIGARIQTVSGIRGQIKKAKGNDGLFRATFEDKIKPSDVVVCKSWIKVEPLEFWNPLMDVPGWRRIRTLAELREAYQLPFEDVSSSNYGAKPAREERRFRPLVLPRKVEQALPLSVKKLDTTAGGVVVPVRAPKVDSVVAEATAPIKSEFEERVKKLFEGLRTAAQTQAQTKREKQARKAAEKSRRDAYVDKLREARKKEKTKRHHALQGAKLKARAKFSNFSSKESGEP